MTQHLVDGIITTEAVEERRDNGVESPDDRSPYVLIVDDEPLVRNFLTRCLQDWGYTVKQAGSAPEALDVIIARPASVVLSDVRMPDHDGLWLAERLRTRWPETSVVMTTAL